MAAVPHICAGNTDGVAIGASTTRFLFVGSGAFADLESSGVEAWHAPKWRTAGTLSNLYINVITNTGNYSTTLRVRINSANGNQSVSIGSGATGHFEDGSNTDAISAGDAVGLSIASAAGSGTLTWAIHGTVFSATTNTCTRFVQSLDSNLATGFYPITGQTNASGTVGTAQALFRTGGTLKNGLVNVRQNSRDGASTWTTSINGSDGTVSVSIPATTTGIFEDTSNSDTVADGDLIAWHMVLGGTTNSITPVHKALDFITTNGQSMIQCNATTAGVANSLTRYLPISGATAGTPVSTESSIYSRILAAKTVSRLHCNVNTNNLNGTATLGLNINGSLGNNSVSITSATTGRFEDTTNSDTLAASDVVSLKLVTGGSSGAVSLYSEGLLWGAFGGGGGGGGGTFSVLLVSP